MNIIFPATMVHLFISLILICILSRTIYFPYHEGIWTLDVFTRRLINVRMLTINASLLLANVGYFTQEVLSLSLSRVQDVMTNVT